MSSPAFRNTMASREIILRAGDLISQGAPEDKSRNEVLGARVNLYMTARKWDMAVAIARHLVEVEPEKVAWWINLAYSVRRSETIEIAEAIQSCSRRTRFILGML
jgi:lipopolysaccharide biosynthesis regulator YciM